MVINLIGFISLLILSGFFSGSETAFMSANRVRIRELVNEGDKKAERVDKLLEDQTKLLTTILIGNNLVNIAASAIATSIAINMFGSKGVGIATGVVTFVILVFGEITPKSIGNNNPIKYAKLASVILLWMEKILYPIILFFTILIKRLIGEDKMISSAFISEEEVRRFVNVSEEEGAIKESEKEMIQSVFEFDDIVVKEIMVPRIDMVCVSKESSIGEIVDLAVEQGHSRIPIFEESIDDIIGLIYVKDLLQLLQKGKENLTLGDLIKPIYFIPESKQINKLLKEMQNRREHMAVILDEYGGTSGLITIEDLLEEIVGDIQDEFDLENKQINLINNKEILVDARVDLDDLNEILPVPLLDEESYETISGFVLHKLGYLPEEKEIIELEGITIEIEKIDEHRIQKLRIYTTEPIKNI
jgi:CBS domain containing-hemolysin-like protein